MWTVNILLEGGLNQRIRNVEMRNLGTEKDNKTLRNPLLDERNLTVEMVDNTNGAILFFGQTKSTPSEDRNYTTDVSKASVV